MESRPRTFIPPEIVTMSTPPVNDRHEAIRKDIASRLRKSCADLSEEEFAALVDRMLKVQLAGEGRIR